VFLSINKGGTIVGGRLTDRSVPRNLMARLFQLAVASGRGAVDASPAIRCARTIVAHLLHRCG